VVVAEKQADVKVQGGQKNIYTFCKVIKPAGTMKDKSQVRDRKYLSLAF